MDALAYGVGRRDETSMRPDGLESGPELAERERAGNAAGEAAALGPLEGAQSVVGDACR